jgi:dihydropteroate synthase type 2
VLVSVSRKSFLQKITGRDAKDSGPATLAAELFATLEGADHIRTHDPAGLRDALRVWNALNARHSGA